MTAYTRLFLLFFLSLQLFPYSAASKESVSFRSEAVTANLVTALDGIPQGAKTLSAGFSIRLSEDWKTYWRTPGEVGIPPTIDWSRSENVTDVTFFWPAPRRFRAFGIENFGYKGEVVFPLSIELTNPGEPVRLRAQVNMLTCSLVCVPQDFELTLDLPAGGALDQDAATLIAEWSQRVPVDSTTAGVTLENVAFTGAPNPAITVEVQSATAFFEPDVFPELTEGTTFGPPDIRLGDGGRRLWARIPLTNFDEEITEAALTITDGDRAVSLQARPFDPIPPVPPYTVSLVAPEFLKIVRMALIALVGGLILNIMPCVLPVLSIKLASALKVNAGGQARIRAGFLLSAAGVMAFMLVLAGILIILRALGLSVGWGIQFQNPVFLTAMVALLVLFAANLFGIFEINLPHSWTSWMATASGSPSWLGDFSVGVFAAMLATPCSAPLLGTAVAFALAGRPVDVLVIFTAMGIGLALPYLLVALKPGLVSALPKPGRWMQALKVVLGLLLAGTAVWLLWVLNGVAGRDMVFIVTLPMVVAIAALAFKVPEHGFTRRLRSSAVAALITTSLVASLAISPSIAVSGEGATAQKVAWVAFDRSGIAKRVSAGEVVFLDITADWCITCKANKGLVINRNPVVDLLNGGTVVPMQADWTRPDEAIAQFLKDNSRYGIPFNAVYGPSAPEGILLSELLTTDAVLDALRQAGALVPATP
jgi:suppressor for copper-sensitivity B